MNNQIYLQPEDVLSFQPILGFYPSYCNMSGTIDWSKKDSDVVVYSTPNWEEEGKCPISYVNTLGDYVDVANINLVGLSIEEQKEKICRAVLDVISAEPLL